jgi:hypothetical protein
MTDKATLITDDYWKTTIGTTTVESWKVWRDRPEKSARGNALPLCSYRLKVTRNGIAERPRVFDFHMSMLAYIRDNHPAHYPSHVHRKADLTKVFDSA